MRTTCEKPIKLLILSLACTISLPAFCVDNFSLPKSTPQPARIFGIVDYEQPGLIRVNFLSGAAVPGKYFVTPHTDLFDLISIAGGLNENSDLDDVTVRRRNVVPETVLSFDGTVLLKNSKSEPFYFADNDILLIKTKKPVISQDVMTLTNFTASVLSITVTAILLSQKWN